MVNGKWSMISEEERSTVLRFTIHASRFDKLTVPSQVEGRLTVPGSNALAAAQPYRRMLKKAVSKAAAAERAGGVPSGVR
jgi:hypothetical protein